MNEIEQLDYELHTKAGLIHYAINSDGKHEWVGTDEQWNTYIELSEKALSDLF